MKTKVLFRMFYEECLALFPEVPGNDDPYMCSCYAHIGQHSYAAPDTVIRFSKPATPSEYRLLAKELRRAGYKLIVGKRLALQKELTLRRNLIKVSPTN